LSGDLTWEEWVEIGKAFKKINRLLMKEILEAKPKNGDWARKLRKAEKSFGIVQSTLDDMVCAAFPQRKFPDKKAARVFYGPIEPDEV
jgi:hypothetical protein